MPEYQIQQSTTAYPLVFLMVLSSDHITGATGLSPTVTISKSGGAFASPSGAVSELANGWYKVAGSATDTSTLGPLILHATAATADPTDTTYEVVAYNPQDSVHLGLTSLPNTAVTTNASLLTSGTGTDQLSVSAGKTLLQATQTGVTIPTVATVTNQLTAAAIATGVWQDATAGDFTASGSIGKSLFTTGNAPGTTSGIALVSSLPSAAPTAAAVATAVWTDTTGSDFTTSGSIGKSLAPATLGTSPGSAGGFFIAGTNAATTITSSSGNALTLSSTGSNGIGMAVSGNGSGAGIKATGGATGSGVYALGGSTSGAGLQALAGASGSNGALFGGISAYDITLSGDGLLSGSLTGDVQGKILGGGSSSITGLGVYANTVQWLSSVVVPPNVSGVPIVDVGYSKGTASVGTAGYFGLDWSAIHSPTSGVSLSNTTVGVATSVTNQVTANVTDINGVSCASVTTVSAYIGTTTAFTFDGNGAVKADIVDIAGSALNTSSAQIGVNVVNIAGTASAGAAGAVAIDWAHVENATSTVGLSGTTIGGVTNLTNAPTAGDFTATMKSSLNASTPASITGSVGSVAGNVGGSVASVTGAVGSVTGNVGGSVASVTGAVGSVTGLNASGLSATLLSSGVFTTAALANAPSSGGSVIASGTLQSGTASVVVLASGSPSEDGWATGNLITLTLSGVSETRSIVEYNGSTKAASLNIPLQAIAPSSSTTYVISTVRSST